MTGVWLAGFQPPPRHAARRIYEVPTGPRFLLGGRRGRGRPLRRASPTAAGTHTAGALDWLRKRTALPPRSKGKRKGKTRRCGDRGEMPDPEPAGHAPGWCIFPSVDSVHQRAGTKAEEAGLEQPDLPDAGGDDSPAGWPRRARRGCSTRGSAPPTHAGGGRGGQADRRRPRPGGGGEAEGAGGREGREEVRAADQVTSRPASASTQGNSDTCGMSFNAAYWSCSTTRRNKNVVKADAFYILNSGVGDQHHVDRTSAHLRDEYYFRPPLVRLLRTGWFLKDKVQADRFPLHGHSPASAPSSSRRLPAGSLLVR